ncbi:MAG TPA: nucleotidyltransferase domain-containing protein [Halanaerobiales bacterium]|nr:nucleotidyltransferase domain-containing protein [Halanaerobiales bacterium]
MTEKEIDITNYIKKHLKDIEIEERKTDKLYKKLNIKVRLTAKKIGKKYGLNKIYLFGSLINRDSFHLKSDIDLGVKGIDSKDYLKLWGEFEQKLKHSFDLVNMERCNESLKKHIENEGEIIYDSQKEESQ